MNIRGLSEISVEIPLNQIRQRAWEVLPGGLSWMTLIGLTVLAFIVPFWIAIFVIIYDLYVLIRAVYMSVHLVYAYSRLRFERNINWLGRLSGVAKGPKKYLEELQEKKEGWKKNGRSRELKQLRYHLRQVDKLVRDGVKVIDWTKVQQLVIFSTYDESLLVLRTSLDSLVAVDWPKDRMHVVVGFEERAGEKAKERARVLKTEYGNKFKSFIIAWHPDGLPGEERVKSANATWAAKKAVAELEGQGIEEGDVLVSNFDSDTVADRAYFAQLTYKFVTLADRYRVSYQPLPMYHNNVWDAPAFSRVIATGSTFWQMIESTRPERLVTFSSHAMTLRALKDVGYWQTDVISEDSRIFWQCLLKYEGNYRTEPLYTTVSMDAALADTWWKTFKNQYKQKRRWAWGIENFPYIAEGFRRNKRIPRKVKWLYLFRTLEGHYSWATAPIIIAGLGWLPIFFGGPEFHATVLSYSLPYMARGIVSLAMMGLIISTGLSLLLLPPRPVKYSAWRYLGMIFQWFLVPIIATVLSAVPALDAETRLMLGRDLKFNVMQKSRKS